MRWNDCLLSYVRAFILNLAIVGLGFLLLGVFRFALIVGFQNHITEWPTINEWFRFLGRSSWFDVQIAFLFFLPIWVLSLGCLFSSDFYRILNKVRCGYLWVYFGVLIVGCVVNFLFFSEYHENLNAWAFQFLYEDQCALWMSVWLMYPLIKISIGILLGLGCVVFVSRKILNYLESWSSAWRKRVFWLYVFCVLGVVVQVCGFRGSYQSRPLKKRDADISANAFFLKLVATPFHTLLWGYQDQKNLKFLKASTLLTHEALNTMSQALWGCDWEGFKTYEAHTRKMAKGSKCKVKPNHVFLIVMESQNNWPMISPYDSLGMNPNLIELAQKGLWLKSFLPSGCFTSEALCALMTGLHEAGLVFHYQKGSQKPYLSSLPSTMKSIGFDKVHFFDAGYINWCRMDVFGRNQGFDAVFGAIDAGKDSRSDGKVWGLNDPELLDHVFNKLNKETTSFNMIMTITNHVPFFLSESELDAVGCPVKTVPDSLRSLDDGSVPLRIHGHTWYADHYVGAFIDKVEAAFGPCLFVIVGDHWSRYFINQKPGLYERTSVPFMLYGPQVLEGVEFPEVMAGDHVDVMPTLVELLAPTGFIYHSQGKDLLDKQVLNPAGFGADAIITPDFIFSQEGGDPIRLPWAREGVDAPDVELLRKRYSALKTLAEWVACDPESFNSR